MAASVTRFDMHPLSMPSFHGVTVDGRPARLLASDDPTRVRFLPGVGGLDVEFVATGVPAFGCRRYAVEPAEAAPDEVDDGREIARGRHPGRCPRRRLARGRTRRRHLRRPVRYRGRDRPRRFLRLRSRSRAGARRALGDRRADAPRVGHRTAPGRARAHRDRHAHRRSVRRSRRSVRPLRGRARQPRTGPPVAAAVPDRGRRRHLRRRDDVRHGSAFDRADRRYRLDAPRPADVPAAGVDRGQRAGRRRTRAPRGGGHPVG